MNRARIGGLAVAGVALLVAGGTAAVMLTRSGTDDNAPMVQTRAIALALAAQDAVTNTIPAIEIPPGGRIGACGIVVIAPDADPCEKAQGMSGIAFWDSMKDSTLFQNWKKSNPGEWSRLQAHMAAPLCDQAPGVGLPQDMITPFGAALFADVTTYACARGTTPIIVQPPNPPPLPGSKDKKPPSAPGPVTAAPDALTNG